MAVAPAHGLLRRGACTRHTVDEDPEALPGRQIWLDQKGGVWHDLHHVHQAMFERGVDKEWGYWREACLHYWQMMGVDASHFQLDTGRPELLSNVADSHAVLAVLWQTAEVSRSDGRISPCRNWLGALQGRLERALAPAQSNVQVLHEGILTTLLVNGSRLSGWGAWFPQD